MSRIPLRKPSAKQVVAKIERLLMQAERGTAAARELADALTDYDGRAYDMSGNDAYFLSPRYRGLYQIARVAVRYGHLHVFGLKIIDGKLTGKIARDLGRFKLARLR